MSDIKLMSESYRDEMLRSLGLVTVNFSALQHIVEFSIAQLLIEARGSKKLSDINFQQNLAMTITAEFPFYKLLTMLSSLYKHMERDTKKVKEFEEIVNQAGEAANQRDRLTHSAFFTGSFDKRIIAIKIDS